MRQFRRAAVLLLLAAASPLPVSTPSSPLVFAQESSPAAPPSAGVFPVPPAVRTEGIPPIPLVLAESVAQYGTFRFARLLDWHPTERRILITTAFGNVPQIHEVRAPGAARTQLTFFREGIPGGDASFSPDGRFMVIRRDLTGGTEAFQLLRQEMSSGRVTLLTDGKSVNGAPVWAHGKSLMAYSSTRRDGKNRDLYIMDPSDPKTDRRLLEVEGSWSPAAWSPDNRELIAVESISSSELYLWRIDVERGTKTALTERGQRVAWRSLQMLPNGVMFALGNRNSDTPAVWRLQNGKWAALTQPADFPESFAVSPDGRTVAVVFDRGASSQLLLLDASNGRTKVTPRLPAGVISSVAWRATGNELAFTFAGASSLADVYSVEAGSGRLHRWTTSETGGVPTDSLPQAEVVEWKTFDGLLINGVLYRPAAQFTGPRPVIINVHGGPVDRERPRFLGRSNYFRNEMGVAIIYPNIRGSRGRGKAFEELDNGMLRENAVKDIGALLDFIKEDPTLDENRVMIIGGSYGGYVALASAIAYGDRLRSAHAALAISDYPSYLESTEVRRQTNRNAEYGDPADPKMREYLTSISPLTNAARLKIPLYLVHAGKDTRIPPDQAEKMVQAVKQNGTPLWYAVYENEGHTQFSNANNDLNQFIWTMFVQKYLLD
jgi:dipeptidyl aminopeptidase/acylaminoacyl peptidase